MKKYFLAVVSFLFSFIGVAIIVSSLMVVVFPPQEGRTFVGAGSEWRYIPGMLLGLWPGIHSARVSLRQGKPKGTKK